MVSSMQTQKVVIGLCPLTMAMSRARQGRRWQAHRTKASWLCVNEGRQSRSNCQGGRRPPGAEGRRDTCGTCAAVH